MSPSIEQLNQIRIDLIETDEGFAVNIDIPGELLKELQSKAEERNINLEQRLMNCIATDSIHIIGDICS